MEQCEFDVGCDPLSSFNFAISCYALYIVIYIFLDFFPDRGHS